MIKTVKVGIHMEWSVEIETMPHFLTTQKLLVLSAYISVEQ